MQQNLKQHVFHWISQGVQDLCGFAVEAVIRGSVTSPLATTLGSTGLWVGPGTVSECSQAVGETGVLLGDCWNAMNFPKLWFLVYFDYQSIPYRIPVIKDLCSHRRQVLYFSKLEISAWIHRQYVPGCDDRKLSRACMRRAKGIEQQLQRVGEALFSVPWNFDFEGWFGNPSQITQNFLHRKEHQNQFIQRLNSRYVTCYVWI